MGGSLLQPLEKSRRELFAHRRGGLSGSSPAGKLCKPPPDHRHQPTQPRETTDKTPARGSVIRSSQGCRKTSSQAERNLAVPRTKNIAPKRLVPECCLPQQLLAGPGGREPKFATVSDSVTVSAEVITLHSLNKSTRGRLPCSPHFSFCLHTRVTDHCTTSFNNNIPATPPPRRI